MSIKHSKWIVPTALALAVSTAWAGQITLYERPDFRGPSMVAANPVDVVQGRGWAIRHRPSSSPTVAGKSARWNSSAAAAPSFFREITRRWA
jgi:hypothetical protein